MNRVPVSRRPFIRYSAAMVLSLAAMGAQAQKGTDAAASWPNKAVRIVVPLSPGGATDILARSVGEVLQRELKQPFVVDNRPGAGGNIGAEAIAKSAGDGYSLLISLDTTFSINPFIYQSMPFKSTDLRPVMVIASQGSIIVVNPKSGIRTLDELIAKGKKQALSMSSAGYGSPGHLGTAILAHATGIKVNHVPYKGAAPASTAVVAGEVDGGVLSATALAPNVNAGKATALAITTAHRSPMLPNVPTVGELGRKDLGTDVLLSMWAPASTPDALVQKIQQALLQAAKDPQLQERLRNNDLYYEGLVGDAAARRLQAQADRNRAVIQATGMKME